MIDQCGEIAGIIGGIGTVGERARRRKAAMGKYHAGVAVAEVRNLLPPAQMIAAEAVREYQHGSGAGDLVIHAAIGTLEMAARHRAGRVKSNIWKSLGARRLRIDHRGGTQPDTSRNVRSGSALRPAHQEKSLPQPREPYRVPAASGVFGGVRHHLEAVTVEQGAVFVRRRLAW